MGILTNRFSDTSGSTDVYISVDPDVSENLFVSITSVDPDVSENLFVSITSVDPDVSENLFVSIPIYIHQLTRTCQKTCLSVFPYIFQAKYIRNKKINENKLVGGTTTWGTIWGSCLRAPVHLCSIHVFIHLHVLSVAKYYPTLGKILMYTDVTSSQSTCT